MTISKRHQRAIDILYDKSIRSSRAQPGTGLYSVIVPWWLITPTKLYDRTGNLLGCTSLKGLDRKHFVYEIMPPMQVAIYKGNEPIEPEIFHRLRFERLSAHSLLVLEGKEYVNELPDFLSQITLPMPWYLLRIMEIETSRIMFEIASTIEYSLNKEITNA